MQYHLTAFIAGFILDLILGDPYRMPHPVRLIGGLTGKLEKTLYKMRDKRRAGRVMVFLVLVITTAISGVILSGAYYIHPVAGCVIETIMTYQILATKCLRTESMKVYKALTTGTIEEARKAVSMIVGRDTALLDVEGVTKAAVETVAENTSDGVIAPMLYLAVGGPVLGFVYKSINTMDSMIGYKNERYIEFGRTAARLDDFVNYIPSRVSAVFMIIGAAIGGKDLDWREAYRIYKRDRRNHASPNSAQTEAVCAGALRIRLAGDASYFGKIVHKPWIGDAGRKIEADDIKRADRLLYLTAFLCEIVCSFILWCLM